MSFPGETSDLVCSGPIQGEILAGKALSRSLDLLRRPQPHHFESFIDFPLPLGGHSHRRKLLLVRHKVPQAHVLSFRLQTVHQDRLRDQGQEVNRYVTPGALSRLGYQGAMSGRQCNQEGLFNSFL